MQLLLKGTFNRKRKSQTSFCDVARKQEEEEAWLSVSIKPFHNSAH